MTRKRVSKKDQIIMAEKMELLYEMKQQVKFFEADIKKLQTEILESSWAPDEYALEDGGFLRYTEQENFETLDAGDVYDETGEEWFFENCSIAAGKIKKELGEAGFEKLLKDGTIGQKDDSVFYKFYKTAKKK